MKPVAVGSDDFFASQEANKNRRRIVVFAKQGDTLDTIGRKHGVSGATMERVNRRGRNETLKEGEQVDPTNSS